MRSKFRLIPFNVCSGRQVKDWENMCPIPSCETNGHVTQLWMDYGSTDDNNCSSIIKWRTFRKIEKISKWNDLKFNYKMLKLMNFGYIEWDLIKESKAKKNHAIKIFVKEQFKELNANSMNDKIMKMNRWKFSYNLIFYSL